MADQTVLITGGTRGIGYATAQAFLAQGAHVALCGTNPANLKAAQHQLEALAVRADVSDSEQVQAFVRQARARFGRIDVLVNNAGVAWSGDFADESYDSIARQIDVNVKGVLYTARAVLPLMLKQGGGVIINISSGAGLTGFAGIATYSAAKFWTGKSAAAASASTASVPAAWRPTCSRPTTSKSVYGSAGTPGPRPAIASSKLMAH